MITAKQKQMLHIAARSLGIDRDSYEAILFSQAGVRSSNDLDNAGFDNVIRRFEELGFRNTARRTRRYRPARPQGAVTPDQQQLIEQLYQQLGWTEMPRKIGFNKRACKKSWPQTRTDANKVIEGLKAMLHRQEASVR